MIRLSLIFHRLNATIHLHLIPAPFLMSLSQKGSQSNPSQRQETLVGPSQTQWMSLSLEGSVKHLV